MELARQMEAEREAEREQRFAHLQVSGTTVGGGVRGCEGEEG